MSAVIFVILCYIAAGAFIAWRIKGCREPEQDDEPREYDVSQMENEISALHQDMERLKELDEMMLDLRLCNPNEMQRSFRMEWQSLSGKDHRFDFWADGKSRSTEYLLGLAQTERNELNDTIARRISALYYRANALGAVSKTVIKTTARGEYE